MTKRQKSKNTERLTLRLPPELKEALAAAAELNGRTLTAEILDRLQAKPSIELLSSIARQSQETHALTREIHALLQDR